MFNLRVGRLQGVMGLGRFSGLQATSFRLSGLSFLLCTKRAMGPPWQASCEEYRRYDVGHACHTSTQPPPPFFFTASNYASLAFSSSDVQGLREKSSFLFPRLPPFPPVPDPRPTGFHPKPLSPQTQTAGVTPGPTFMLSLFSCSRVFENL